MADVIDFKDDAHRKAVQLVTLFRALVLEGKTGMQMSSRGSALSVAKKQFGFAGTRNRILHQVHYSIEALGYEHSPASLKYDLGRKYKPMR
jgi:RNase P protein component